MVRKIALDAPDLTILVPSRIERSRVGILEELSSKLNGMLSLVTILVLSFNSFTQFLLFILSFPKPLC